MFLKVKKMKYFSTFCLLISFCLPLISNVSAKDINSVTIRQKFEDKGYKFRKQEKDTILAKVEGGALVIGSDADDNVKSVMFSISLDNDDATIQLTTAQSFQAILPLAEDQEAEEKIMDWMIKCTKAPHSTKAIENNGYTFVCNIISNNFMFMAMK